MDSTPAYPTEKTYGAFLHRELSVSWLLLATLLGRATGWIPTCSTRASPIWI